MIKYALDDNVWLRKKTFGRNENKKLSPRRTGPWKIVKIYPNGVNFKIEDQSNKKTVVVHHNRLSPATVMDTEDISARRSNDETANDSDTTLITESENEEGDETPAQGNERRYPERIR